MTHAYQTCQESWIRWKLERAAEIFLSKEKFEPPTHLPLRQFKCIDEGSRECMRGGTTELDGDA